MKKLILIALLALSANLSAQTFDFSCVTTGDFSVNGVTVDVWGNEASRTTDFWPHEDHLIEQIQLRLEGDGISESSYSNSFFTPIVFEDLPFGDYTISPNGGVHAVYNMFRATFESFDITHGSESSTASLTLDGTDSFLLSLDITDFVSDYYNIDFRYYYSGNSQAQVTDYRKFTNDKYYQYFYGGTRDNWSGGYIEVILYRTQYTNYEAAEKFTIGPRLGAVNTSVLRPETHYALTYAPPTTEAARNGDLSSMVTVEEFVFNLIEIDLSGN